MYFVIHLCCHLCSSDNYYTANSKEYNNSLVDIGMHREKIVTKLYLVLG